MHQKLTAVQETKFIIQNASGSFLKDNGDNHFIFDTFLDAFEFLDGKIGDILITRTNVWSIKNSS